MTDSQGKTLDEASPSAALANSPDSEVPTKAYVLKAGAEHYTITKGEQHRFVGKADGSVAVDLTDEQARNFADKLDLTREARDLSGQTLPADGLVRAGPSPNPAVGEEEPQQGVDHLTQEVTDADAENAIGSDEDTGGESQSANSAPVDDESSGEAESSGGLGLGTAVEGDSSASDDNA
jgi:hypothetical protein